MTAVKLVARFWRVVDYGLDAEEPVRSMERFGEWVLSAGKAS